jgi:predicted molibdopterin-dependent oxidoreductase YjgC
VRAELGGGGMKAHSSEPDRLPAQVGFFFEDRQLWAPAGFSIAAALWANGIRRLRWGRSGRQGGLFCGMGICFDCLVRVEGQGAVRACRTEVVPGQRVYELRD